MAWNTDKILEDLKTGIGLTPPGAIGKGIAGIAGKIKGNEAEIMKVIRELLKRTPPGQAAEVVKLIVDRYKLDPAVAQRMVANEMADANIPTDPSGTADEGYTERGLGPDAGAEDYYLERKKEISPDRNLADLLEQWKNMNPEDRLPPKGWEDPGFKETPLHPDATQIPHHLDINPLQTMEFRDANQDGIEDRSQGIYAEDRDLIPWDPNRKNRYLNQGGRAGYNQGGRTGFQTGGITESRVLPPEYIEALGKTYAADLTRQAGIPSITTATAQQPGETAQQWQQRQGQAQQYGITKAGMADLAPQVASQDAYQTAAYAQAVDPTTGLGAYQPYLADAKTAATAATGLTGTGAGTGAGSISSYMSPYQQQVIDATMADYDAQAAKSRLGLGAQAVAGGAYGAGRHGIAEAEFDALSNRGRASQLANLRSTGFQQAAQRRQQDLQNQMGLTNLQTGLGQTAQDFGRAQIAGLGTLGATQQAQNQAVLDAQRQFATMAVQEPVNRMNMLGTGVMGLMGGMSPYSTRIGEAPATAQSSPLATALGVGLTGADIYSRLYRPKS